MADLEAVEARLRRIFDPYRSSLGIDETLFSELEELTAKSIERQPKVVEQALAARAGKRLAAKGH